jgi:oligopeptide/dipeptide ABC transporter ATP-binding protein
VCDRVIVMYAGQVVETGTVHDIFLRPRHPYTQGLLDSLPKVTEGHKRLRPIRGAVPSPTAWPEGCRFRPRCPHAWERCGAEMPPLLVPSGEDGTQASRCWLEEDPGRRKDPAHDSEVGR